MKIEDLLLKDLIIYNTSTNLNNLELHVEYFDNETTKKAKITIEDSSEITQDGSTINEIKMEGHDGELLDFSLIKDNKLEILIEWTNYQSKIHKTYFYEMSYKKISCSS